MNIPTFAAIKQQIHKHIFYMRLNNIKKVFLAFSALLSAMSMSAAERFVSFKQGDLLINGNDKVEIYMDANDCRGVSYAANALVRDISKVSGSQATITSNRKATILVGTIGMKCKKFLAAAAACLMVAGLAACGNKPSTPSNPDEKVFQIGIVQLAEHPALDEATRGFKEFLTEKLGDKVQFNVQNAQGEQTNCTTIVNQFVSSKVDLIMANATNAVKAAREATSDIPVVGTSVTDYVSSGLVASNEAPGANVTGASDMNPVNVQVQLMKTLCPEVKTVGIVINSGEENSAIQAEEAKTAFEAEGFTVKIYSVADTNEIQTVVTAACNEVDAFYEPTDNLIAANVPTMSNITTAAGKPVICGEGGMCESGFLATYAISYYELGRAAGEQAYNILVNGADPATTPIFFFDVSNLSLVINEENAAELGITIPEELK